MIPKRFWIRLDEHLLGNFIPIDKYPLILAIIGKPGMGKSYQLRKYLKDQGVKVFSVSAADLESDTAGYPAKLVQRKYKSASDTIETGTPAALVIDDIDTTLGERDNYTGTINHYDIIAFLMHVADNPYYIEDEGKTRRVPIFFTGNDFGLLYSPLVREGRAAKFDWEPNREEIIEIISDHYKLSSPELAAAFVDKYSNKEVAYYTSFLEQSRIQNVMKYCNLCFADIVSSPQERQRLKQVYESLSGEAVIKTLLKENDTYGSACEY